jgi:hypothetical protein
VVIYVGRGSRQDDSSHVHNTLESPESLFEVITLWTRGMLWGFAPLAFPVPLLLLRDGCPGGS